MPLLVPADQAATPTVAFLSPDTELPADMAADAAAVHVPAVDVRRLVDGVDLIKLDVEGQEHVLLGAVRDVPPDESSDPVRRGPGRNAAAARPAGRPVRADGYRCYAFSREGLVELDGARLATARLMDEFGCQDVLLCAHDLPEGPRRAFRLIRAPRRHHA